MKKFYFVILFLISALLLIGSSFLIQNNQNPDNVKWLIQPVSDSVLAAEFNHGVTKVTIAVRVKNEIQYRNIFYNISGQEISEEEYNQSFQEKSYQDKISSFPNYKYVSNFKDGIAVAVKQSGSILTQKYYFIDQSGKSIFDTEYAYAENFSNGAAIVRFPEDKGKFSVIDKAGAVILKTPYSQMGSFSEGLAPFYNSAKDKWGYLNQDGKVIIKPFFTHARCFQEGIAAVETKDGWGYISHP